MADAFITISTISRGVIGCLAEKAAIHFSTDMKRLSTVYWRRTALDEPALMG
jgi:hypothetical protein